MILETDIRFVVRYLLNRPLTKSDGIPEIIVAEHEKRLGFKFPQALRDLYLYVGNCEDFLSAHNIFYTLDEMGIENDKLVFAEENQGSVAWAVALDESEEVFHQPNHEKVWYSEELNIEQFLIIILYYQCAQGYYEYCGYVNLENIDEVLAKDWTKVVEHNGLIIYSKNKEKAIIWRISGEDDIFFSIPSKEIFDKYKNDYQLDIL